MIFIAVSGFILACILLFLLMPFIIRLSHQINAVAVPNERTMHNSIMPRLGGLAIYTSFMLTILLLLPWTNGILKPFYGILLASFIIELIGIIDDKYTLSAKWKALGQIIASCVVISFGLTIDQIHIPFGEDIYFPSWLSILLTIIWIVGIINAVNWIDGLDGLASGITGIALITIIVISLMVGNFPVLVMCCVLLGSLCGFFYFNFEPAKIFMGESGSAFLGFILATISILGFKQAVFVSFIIPLLILGVPLFDTILAMTRRLVNRKPLHIADRGHVHHNLVDLGLTKKSTVFLLYGISALFGLCAIILTKASSSEVMMVLVILVVSLILVLGAELVGIMKKRRMLFGILRRVENRNRKI